MFILSLWSLVDGYLCRGRGLKEAIPAFIPWLPRLARSGIELAPLRQAKVFFARRFGARSSTLHLGVLFLSAYTNVCILKTGRSHLRLNTTASPETVMAACGEHSNPELLVVILLRPEMALSKSLPPTMARRR